MTYKRKKKDILRRKSFFKLENEQNVSKFIFYYCKDSLLKRLEKKDFFYKKKVKSCKTKIKNYCTESGRSRGIIKDFKISRIVFRELGGKGFFFGLKKAS
jgi:ribosomal protein S14